jgi:hypothetical protein
MLRALNASIHAYCAASDGERCVGTETVKRGETLCYQLETLHALQTFPSLTVALGDGVEVTIPAQHLFMSMPWSGGLYCLAVYPNYRGTAVLGGNFLLGNDVVSA